MNKTAPVLPEFSVLAAALGLMLLIATPASAALTITTSSLPDASTYNFYDNRIATSGGTGVVECTASRSEIPEGMYVNFVTCQFQGTPTLAGTYSILFTATSGAETATRRLTLTVRNGMRLAYSYGTWLVGRPLSMSPSTMGGQAPLSFRVDSGTMPKGVQLNGSTGVISGTPMSVGSFYPWIRVTDAAGATATARADMDIGGQAIILSPAPGTTLPRGKAGYPYSFQFTASGGTAPYTFTAPSISPGLSLSSSGLLSGRPLRDGYNTVTVSVSDALGSSNTGNVYSFTADVGGDMSPRSGGLTDGVVGTPYSFTLTVTGMGAGLSGSASGDFPPGLSVGSTASTLVVQGTPTRAGYYVFRIVASDQAGGQIYGDFVMTVKGVPASPLKIDSTSLATGQVGVPYSFKVAVSGGEQPYQFSMGPQIPGLSMNSSTGEISGTPTVVIDGYLSITVRDAAMGYANKSLILKITSPNLKLTYNPLPLGTVGVSYGSGTITVSDGVGPYSLQVGSGSPPPGISLTVVSAGYGWALTGTPTAAGSYSFRLAATDSQGKQGSADVTMQVVTPTLTIGPATLPQAAVGTAYLVKLTASGGVAPYTFSYAGVLPVSFFDDGTLAGVPGAAGSFPVTFTVRDSSGAQAAKAYTLVVSEGGLTVSGMLAGMVLAQDYQGQLTASGGTAPYQFAVLSGALPAGLSLSAAGSVSGKPAMAGDFQFSIQATDATGRTGWKQFNVTVQGATLTIGPATLPDVRSGQTYSVQFTVTGGVPPYSFHMPVATLMPYWLSFSASGWLQGTGLIDSDAVSQITVSVKDAQGSGGWRSYTLALKAAVGLQMLPVQLPTGFPGTAYTAQLSVTGGSAPYSYALTTGSLPAGLNLRGDGLISGSPQQTGSTVATIEATDATGAKVSRQYTVQVMAASLTLSPATLGAAQKGVAYAAAFSAGGGRAPYRYTVTIGELPNGLALRESGQLEGTPTLAGSWSFRVSAADADGVTVDRQYTLEVRGGGLAMGPASLSDGRIGAPYGATLECSGGQGACEFTVTSGGLAKGLVLEPQGRLSGTPAETGAFRFGVQARDQAGATAGREYELKIAGVGVTPVRLETVNVGVGFRVTLGTEPALAGVTWRLSQGNLPAGVTLSAGGELGGAAQAGGVWNFEVEAAWNGGVAGRRSYTLLVSPGVTITTTELPKALAGQFYQARVAAAGGEPPYLFGFDGAAPAGMQMQADGLLAGVPGWDGDAEIGVEVKDAAGRRTSKRLVLTVERSTLRIETTWIPEGRVGVAYSAPLTATGGTPPYAWRLSGGRLPAGMALSELGTLAGKPSEGGVFSLVMEATDQAGRRADRALSLTVQAGTGMWFVQPSELEFQPAGAATETQCVAVFGTATGLKVTAQLQLSGFHWAELVDQTASAPGRICVQARAAGLAAGEWRGELVLEAAGALPATARIPMGLRVPAQAGSGFSVAPREATLSLPAGNRNGRSAVLVVNEGGERATITAGGEPREWLRLPEGQLEVEAGQGRLLEWEVDGSGLSAGWYGSEMVLEGAGSQVQVRLRVLAGAAARALESDRSALAFTAWQGQTEALSESVVVRNAGIEDLDLSVRGGSLPEWLDVRAADGLAVEGRLQPGSTRKLEVHVKASGLAAGEYAALIGLLGGASPAEVQVRLRVLGAEESVEARATAVLVARSGGEAESEREAVVAGLPSRRGAVQVVNRGSGETKWLAVEPAAPVADENGTVRLRLKVQWAELKGAAAAQTVLALGFSDGSAAEVRVSATNAAAAEAATAGPRACDAGLTVLILEPAAQFRLTKGAPFGVRAVVQECTGAAPAGRVFARAGSGSAELLRGDDGVYSGSLTAEEAEDAVVQVWAVSKSGALGTAAVRGKVRGGSANPAVIRRVLTGAGTAGPATPEAWLIVEGERLAESEAFDGTGQEELGGARATLGGAALRLSYVSPGRIEAYIQGDVATGTWSDLLVSVGSEVRASRRMAVVPWHPQIYTADGSGTGMALALDVERGVEIGAQNAALPGSTVRVLVSGLGSGIACQAWLGGQEAEVVESRRPKELPGVSEVLLRVPAGAAGQSAAQLQLRQGTVESNVVTVPVGRR